MKTKIALLALTLAVIASFSFISINKEPVGKNDSLATTSVERPFSGIALEDDYNF